MEKHSITIDNRAKTVITAVAGIDTFDEEEVCVRLTEGSLIIKGTGLHIQRLDLQEGEAEISGEVVSLNYVRKKPGKCFFKKKGQ